MVDMIMPTRLHGHSYMFVIIYNIFLLIICIMHILTSRRYVDMCTCGSVKILRLHRLFLVGKLILCTNWHNRSVR